MGHSLNDPEPGISKTLATERAEAIENVRYDLSFAIPEDLSQPVQATAAIRFEAKDTGRPVVLDFGPGPDHIAAVTVGGRPSDYRTVTDHIIIPREEISPQDNVIEISFRADDAPLNRNPEFMYTLFVPARAHLAFPCFDQPDLKARFTLELDVPASWTAVSNGEQTLQKTEGNRQRVRYTETQPISTYLFAFAAGRFRVETAERNGRRYRMFHRETDTKRVERNRKDVFDLHALSLDWLEKYTAIPYPFGKFDFVLIPSFQFGGMEHPGAIFYNASSVLLEESATEDQILERANLIAHETSHMWFGDLVTMKWFDDVWLKEVFANFLAAKVMDPMFPKVSHALRFLVTHYPAAYGVDRTEGTHPISQELSNLKDAGSLYGAIIYHKAPIVMRLLERMLGDSGLQRGLRAYLKGFQFGNATWQDLIRILGELTDRDLKQWSHAWIEEAGRPSIRTVVGEGHIAFVQSDPQEGRSLSWPQGLNIAIGTTLGSLCIRREMESDRIEVEISPEAAPNCVLPNILGMAYADFVLDESTRSYLFQRLPYSKDPLMRASIWITLWEETLNGRVAAADFMDLAMRALPDEDTELNVQLVLNYVRDAFWIFLSGSQRQDCADRLEATLRFGFEDSDTSTLKYAYFAAFRALVTTPKGIALLQQVWSRQKKIPGLVFAEHDEAGMALDLAVRLVLASDNVLEEQRGRFSNPDRRQRFEFVMPAVSDRGDIRDGWFESLRDVRNRRREPWVLEGLQYLHHPLRAARSEKYIRPSLDLLAEIQQTGDIFFPMRWTHATLAHHNTPAAAAIVRDFLAQHPDYPLYLRRIILQAADNLFRASRQE